MKKISSLHKKWLKDPAYRKEYEALEEEFALASAMIAARSRAGLNSKPTGSSYENHPKHNRKIGERQSTTVW